MLLTDRVIPIGIALFLVVAEVGFLGEAYGGRVVYGLALAGVVVLTAWDWWRLRRSEQTPRAVADRLAMDVVVFALVLALPGLETIAANAYCCTQ
jgi:hypothetical protein